MRDDGDRLWRRRSPLQKPSTSVPASSSSRLVDFEDLKAQLRQLPGTTDTQLFGRLEWPLYRPLTEKSDRGKVRKGGISSHSTTAPSAGLHSAAGFAC
jgi:hypothetical protein